MMQQYADNQALNMMASVTKSISQLQNLIEDFNMIAQHADDEEMDPGHRMGGKGQRKGGMGGMGGMMGMFGMGGGRRQAFQRGMM